MLGRSTEPVSVDQPQLTQGNWVDDGGVVLEAAFADSLGVGAGDRITIDDRSFEVVGVAVSAASPPYPGTCFAPCWFGAAAERAASDASGPRLEPPGGPIDIPPIPIRELGLVWLTDEDARNLASDRGPLAYVVNLKLADPAIARGFVDAHLPDSVMSPMLVSWQDVLDGHSHVVANQRRALLTGSWLLCVLAVASIAVLVGGRMSDQIRRVGLIKAVGGTPSLVASVLLAEYVVVAIVAAGIGLMAGWLAAPLLTEAGAGLVGRAGRPDLTLSTVAAVSCGCARRLRRRRSSPRFAAHQHRARPRRLGSAASAHGVADRGLGATAAAAALRVAGGRPSSTTCRAQRAQLLRHRHGARRRADRARHARLEPPRRRSRGSSAHRSTRCSWRSRSHWSPWWSSTRCSSPGRRCSTPGTARRWPVRSGPLRTM